MTHSWSVSLTIFVPSALATQPRQPRARARGKVSGSLALLEVRPGVHGRGVSGLPWQVCVISFGTAVA